MVIEFKHRLGASLAGLALSIVLSSSSVCTLRAETEEPGRERTLNVRDFGAAGNKRTNDRAAIQAAVDACAKAGGGTVLFPPGDYLSSTIRLSSHVTLKIEKRATIWTCKDPTAFSGQRHLFFADAFLHDVRPYQPPDARGCAGHGRKRGDKKV